MDKNRHDVFNLLKFIGFTYIKQKGVAQKWELLKGDDKYTFTYYTDRYCYDLNESTRDLTFKSLLYTKRTNTAYKKIKEIFKHEYRLYIINKLLNDKN